MSTLGSPPADTGIEAWLEDGAGASVPVIGSLSIGREAANSLVLRSEGVSRSHVVLHGQSNGEFWLVDLGSRNGTFLNGQRVLQPARLHDGDRISILKHWFVFRLQSPLDHPRTTEMLPTNTMQQTHELPYWLLITDIENFSGLSQSLSGPDLGAYVGRWIHRCQGVVRANEGRINKYLGDGFFAVWPDAEGSEQLVAAALHGLAEISREADPVFRMVAHRGIVSVTASPLLSEESFLGTEVIFAFQMEKLAGSLRLPQLFSDAAARQLAPLMPLTPLPPQQLKGFDTAHTFFAPEG